MVFIYVFIVSFITNLVWENFHAPLYSKHLNKKIDEVTLLVATVGDAVILTLLAGLFFYVPYLSGHIWLSIPIGFIISIVIEIYALRVGRWSYNKHMPLIPFLGIGLTPTVQLGLLGYIIFKFFL